MSVAGKQPDRLRNRQCWSCQRWHSGHVWCPHCSAPVDSGSTEARLSSSWQNDLRAQADRRPLREVFPTANGHRMTYCPLCGYRCGWSNHHGAYFCPNKTGSRHEGRPLTFQ